MNLAPALFHPVSGAPLAPDGRRSLAGGGERFPVVDGIPYLRAGRAGLRREALARLDRGDDVGARALLLADRDDHAPGPPPDPAALHRLAAGGARTLRGAMHALGFGAVAGYFAHRWSAPTFVSALGLLAEYWRPDLPVIDVACGIGQVLREARASGAAAVGVDVVFSKLWLARRFVLDPGVALVCADADYGLPLALGRPGCVLCHDALYFIADKARALQAMRAAAGEGGALLVGHAHNRLIDQRGVGGTPLSPDEWHALLPEATVFDDAELAAAWVEGRRADAGAPGRLRGAEALALALGPRNPRPETVGGARENRPLRLNPLLERTASGALRPGWPSPALAEEYAGAGYLEIAAEPDAETLADARAGRVSRRTAELARRRVLIDLPEAW